MDEALGTAVVIVNQIRAWNVWRNGHFAFAPIIQAIPRSSRHLGCDAVEPRPEGIPALNRRCLAYEHQKCGLEGILGFVLIANDAATKTEDHRAMALDQDPERLLTDRAGVGLEAEEQVAVAL